MYTEGLCNAQSWCYNVACLLQGEDGEKSKKRKISAEEKETRNEEKETFSTTEMKEKSAEETTEKSTNEEVKSTEEKENEAPAVKQNLQNSLKVLDLFLQDVNSCWWLKCSRWAICKLCW